MAAEAIQTAKMFYTPSLYSKDSTVVSSEEEYFMVLKKKGVKKYSPLS
jgi:hypothetical protein